MKETTPILVAAMILLAGCATSQAQEAPHRKLQAASVEILLNGRLVGSGCVASASGQVLTANHVAPNDKAKLEVMSPTFGRLKGDLFYHPPRQSILDGYTCRNYHINNVLQDISLAEAMPSRRSKVRLQSRSARAPYTKGLRFARRFATVAGIRHVNVRLLGDSNRRNSS